MGFLGGMLVKTSGALDLDSGYIDVYVLDSKAYKQIQKDISRYDNMSSSEVHYALDTPSTHKISMDLSKTYFTKEQILIEGEK